MYESMIFYKSFYDAIKGLDAELQAEIYNAVFSYGLYGEELELSPIANTIFTLIKPQIDANNKRKENGKKGAEYGKLGGRPKKNNPEETPQKPLNNPTETPNVNVNANVNANEIKDNISARQKRKEEKQASKHKHGVNQNVLLTDDELAKLKEAYPDCDERIDALSYYMSSTGKKYADHYMTILNWARREEKEKKDNSKQSQNKFNNFEQNTDYDFDDLERRLIQN